MTAFLAFLNAFAIWFYIGGVVAVLFGIKMLLDARRAARTTLFTLEQEQASDRAFRAVLVMAGATLLIAGVAGINAFVTPAVPPPETDVIEPTAVPFTPPVILPTATRQPTLTPPPPTPGPTARPTAAPRPTTGAQPTAPQQPQPTPTAPTEATTVEPTAPSQFAYPAPSLNTPPNGDSIGSNNIQFRWGMDPFGNQAVPVHLPPDQFYRVLVTFTSRSKNAAAAIAVCTHESSVDKRSGLDVADTRSDSLNSDYKWNVVIVQAASQAACLSGDSTPLSPQSETFTFRLP